MKKLMIVLVAGILLPFCVNAQLGKQMSKYHEKTGVTVTQLDKSLYGLYQRENLTPDIKEMLQQLEEVNILNLDLATSKTDVSNKIITQFRGILDNPEKYKLVKSKNDGLEKQLIYTQGKDGKTTELVVWNQTPDQVDIIELRGDIQLDRIALLSRALNLKSLHSLAALSPNQTPAGEVYTEEEMRQAFEAMRNMGSDIFEGLGSMFGNAFGAPDRSDSTGNHFPGIFDPFGGMEEFMGMFDGFNSEQLKELMKDNGSSQKIEKFFQSFGNGDEVSSSSVQITEENGKTKLKIDAQNSDITYIIDGKQAAKDHIQMPEKIVNVNLIPSREDVKKSYLFITSQEKLGSFTSYKDGILTFKYDNQEYKYNVEKAQDPLLVIDGRLASSFDIDPSTILQIRPVSQIEKEVGYYPNAEVIINTK